MEIQKLPPPLVGLRDLSWTLIGILVVLELLVVASVILIVSLPRDHTVGTTVIEKGGD